MPGARVGQHTAVLLKLIPAAGARYLQSRADLGSQCAGRKTPTHCWSPTSSGARNEMICLLALDGKNKPLGVRKVAEGSICAANINLRRIMEEAAALRAPQIYLAHNHISNLAFPPWWTSPQLRPCGRPWRGWASSCWTTWSLWTGDMVSSAGQRDDEVMPGPCPSVDRALT